jgi:glucosamine--fructose-6-phosphate aminotransferase (isomerizing)
MDDDEVSVLSPSGVFSVGDGTGLMTKMSTKVTWRSTDTSRAGCDRTILKEIMEQPEAFRRATAQDKNLFNQLALDILRADNVIITACGSSRYAAIVGRYLFSEIGGEFCDVIMAPEFHYFSDSVDKNTVVVAVSHGSETADVVKGVEKARERGAKVFSIVNGEGVALSGLSDEVININAGSEIGVTATKSFSNQLAIFYLLAFAMANKFDVGVQKLLQISRELEQHLMYRNANLERLAENLKDRSDFYYIARGINYAIALEGALKLKELSRIHAEGLPAGELKHGTLALVDKNTPVGVICPKDHTFNETLTNAMQAKSRGAYIIGVSDEANDVFDFTIQIPKVEELFYPLVAVIPLQLLAYHLARSQGIDPDTPRNLAESVVGK